MKIDDRRTKYVKIKLEQLQFSWCLGPSNNQHQNVRDSCANQSWSIFGYNIAVLHSWSEPVAGRVTTQDRKMFRNMCQLTALVDLMNPTQTTEPILQCVVLIGSPTLLAKSTVKAAPSSTAKPLETLDFRTPTLRISPTLWEWAWSDPGRPCRWPGGPAPRARRTCRPPRRPSATGGPPDWHLGLRRPGSRFGRPATGSPAARSRCWSTLSCVRLDARSCELTWRHCRRARSRRNRHSEFGGRRTAWTRSGARPCATRRPTWAGAEAGKSSEPLTKSDGSRRTRSFISAKLLADRLSWLLRGGCGNLGSARSRTEPLGVYASMGL